MDNLTEKLCTRCKQSRLLRFFSKSISWCKLCMAETANVRRKYKLEQRLTYINPAKAKQHLEEKELTPEQWELFWPKVKSDELRLLFDIMQNVGLRANEALALTIKDFKDEMVVINTLKQRTNKQGIVSMPVRPDIYKRITSHYKYVQNSLFPYTYRMLYGQFKGTIKRANLNSRLSPHSLRHLFAYRLREAGATEETRAILLRHSSRSVTSLYGKGANTELVAALTDSWKGQTWIWKEA